jgi:hypothetical protein
VNIRRTLHELQICCATVSLVVDATTRPPINRVYPNTPQTPRNGRPAQFDVTTWGWIHILVGIVAILAGVGLFSGAVRARTLAVIAAAISIFANFVWMPYYPVWAVVVIVFDFFVIWALTAHGRDVVSVNDR